MSIADKIINDIEKLRYNIMKESQRDATKLRFYIYLDDELYIQLRHEAEKISYGLYPTMSPNIDMFCECPVFRVKCNGRHYNIAEAILSEPCVGEKGSEKGQ